MRQKKKFIPPMILEIAAFQLEEAILAGSIVDNNFMLESAGQSVNNIDADEQDWNQNWEWDN